MKRVGYGRVSTAGQARNGTSLAEQKKQLMAAGVAEEDIYLDEFKDEIEEWVIEALKDMGCVTAKAVLNTPREDLVNKADLEEETVDNVLAILRAEFEDEEEPAAAPQASADAPADEAPEAPADETPAN